jgi:etoposide-induced 2.4 mRNA
MRLIIRPPDEGMSSNTVETLLEYVLNSMYTFLWIYPAYGISFALSTIWYQDIADYAFRLRKGKPHVPSQFSYRVWVKVMAEELFRALFLLVFTVQTLAVAFIPYLGEWLMMLHMCWLYSLYSFEYSWIHMGWSLDRRLAFFERNWAYFLGFGFPSAVLTYIFPGFYSKGIFAVIFPIFILLAIEADPESALAKLNVQKYEFSLPIVRYAQRVNSLIVLAFSSLCGRRASR